MLAETEDEYRRLLYVAMTRAADRLIIGGCMPGNMNNVRKLCWYDLVGKGLAGSGLHEQTIETPDGAVKRYSRPEDSAAPAATPTPATASPTIELPVWLRALLPTEAPTSSLLRPSDSGGDGRRVLSSEAIADRARAIQRGTLVHRLLQSLPDLAAGRRRDAALNYLARNAAGWREGDRVTLAESVLRLIGDPRFAAVFAEGSRAEVAIVGRIALAERPIAFVSGQIDRLVVTPDEILIVDFKTNQAPPRAVTDAPAAYIRQLALYREILRKLYPRRAVRAALLWTETPELMEILSPALDAELASFAAGRAELDPATHRS
jgi:ATP-dependent helicase/nuclease subunit A